MQQTVTNNQASQSSFNKISLNLCLLNYILPCNIGDYLMFNYWNWISEFFHSNSQCLGDQMIWPPKLKCIWHCDMWWCHTMNLSWLRSADCIMPSMLRMWRYQDIQDDRSAYNEVIANHQHSNLVIWKCNPLPLSCLLQNHD